MQRYHKLVENINFPVFVNIYTNNFDKNIMMTVNFETNFLKITFFNFSRVLKRRYIQYFIFKTKNHIDGYDF